MEFKVDENLPIEVAQALIAAGHGACTIHVQQMVGQPDPIIADVCRDEGRVLLTLDMDFADIRAYPPAEYGGLIVLRPRTQSKPAVLSLVQLLIPKLDREPLAGCLWLVDPVGIRIRQGEASDEPPKFCPRITLRTSGGAAHRPLYACPQNGISSSIASWPCDRCRAAEVRLPQRRRADAAGGMTPTGVDRSGAQRSASLERVLAWGLRSRACSASWNRRMRTRMCGGVGAGRGNPPGYPISG